MDHEGCIAWGNVELVGQDRVARFVVRATGFQPHVGPWLDLAGDASYDLGDVVLRRAEPIGGVVRDTVGTPIRDAVLEVVPDQPVLCEEWVEGLGSPASVRTDDGGRFVFDELAPGAYRLRCASPGAPAPVSLLSGTSDVWIFVPVDSTAAPKWEPGSITVLALDHSGERAEDFGACVIQVCGDERVQRNRNSSTRGRAVVRFHSAVIEGSSLALIVTNLDNGQEVTLDPVTPRADPYVVHFGPMHEIRGRVILEGRTGCESPGRGRNGRTSVSVTADVIEDDSSRCRYWRPGLEADVADDGAFRLVVPNLGRYRISATGYTTDGEMFACRTETSADVVELVLRAEPLSSVLVHVTAPEGETLQEWKGAISESEWPDCVETTDDGLRVGGLRPGRAVELTVSASGSAGPYQPAKVTIAADAESVEVRLDHALAIEGIIERPDGSPVVRASVRASLDATGECLEAVSDIHGRYRIVGLRPGAWRLTGQTDALSAERTEVPAGSSGVRLVSAPRTTPF